MKPNLLRWVVLVVGLVLVVTGFFLAARHQDILGDPHQLQDRMTEVLPTAIVLLAGLIAVVGAFLLRQDGRGLAQLLAAVGVLSLGGWGAEALILTKGEAQVQQPQSRGPLVEVIVAERQDVPVTINGFGTVEAKVRTQIVPQVSGRVAAVHPMMVSGGLVPSGETLLRIDADDYELAVEQAQTEMAQAEADLATADARIAEVQARYDDIQDDLERTRDLVRRGVANKRELDKAQTQFEVAQAQLRTVQAERETAQSRVRAASVALRQARLNLERTQITLPYDAVVLSEQVDEGQHVVAGQPVGEVYSTAAVEIPVKMEDRELQWLPSLPLAGRMSSTSPQAELPMAVIEGQFAGQLCRWVGTVTRVEGQIDPRSRMVSVVVQVDNPMAAPSTERPPLVPGAFVETTVHGTVLEDVVPVPRHAVHEDDRVWVVEDGRLQIVPVEVARRDRQTVYVSEGLESGDWVITSPMDAVTEGMKVRVPADAVAEDAESAESDTQATAASDTQAEPTVFGRVEPRPANQTAMQRRQAERRQQVAND